MAKRYEDVCGPDSLRYGVFDLMRDLLFRTSWKDKGKLVLVFIGAVFLVFAYGCTNGAKLPEGAAPMIAVRLATVAAVQGDPARAQRVVEETDILIKSIDAGGSIALDVLVPALQARIDGANLKPAERALLLELVNTAVVVVQAQSGLPEDARARLRLVLSWVRSAALGQVLAAPSPKPPEKPAPLTA